MNSTELYILAGEAICAWGKEHNEGCVLTLDDGVIFCCKIPEGPRTYKNALIISDLEVTNGMRSARWNEIGTALHYLYCKELSCQAHQKH